MMQEVLIPKLTPLGCIIHCVPSCDGAESPCPTELSPDPVSPRPRTCRPPHATGARPSPTALGIVTPREHLRSFSQLLLEPATRAGLSRCPLAAAAAASPHPRSPQDRGRAHCRQRTQAGSTCQG